MARWASPASQCSPQGNPEFADFYSDIGRPLAAGPGSWPAAKPGHPACTRRPHPRSRLCVGVQGEGAEAALAAGKEVEDDDMHWSVDIMAVRCVEKMLDVLTGGGWWVGG